MSESLLILPCPVLLNRQKLFIQWNVIHLNGLSFISQNVWDHWNHNGDKMSTTVIQNVRYTQVAINSATSTFSTLIWWSDFFSERIVIYLTWNHKWEKNCDAIYHNNTTIVHVHSTRYHLCFGGSRDQTIMPRAHLHNLVQTQFLPTMTTVSWSIERSAVPDILGNPV